MVWLKSRYLDCMLRTIQNVKIINHMSKQLPSLCRAFTSIANTEDLDKLPKEFEGWQPVDDVYRINCYPAKVRPIAECIDDLRAQDKWAYCRKRELHGDRTVNLSLLLDLSTQKKKNIDPFRGMAILPHQFKPDNKVLCFAEGEQATEALDSGAHIIGDNDLIERMLNDEWSDYDYVVASPSVMTSLMPLKSKLKKKFPSSKRGSVGIDMKKMVGMYSHGIEYKVQTAIPHVNVAVGKLSLSNSQIEENVKALIEAVCKHKPAAAGPLIRKATINAFLLDGYQFTYNSYVPASEQQ